MKLNILLAALLLISSAMSRAAVPQTYIYRADERQFHCLEGVTEKYTIKEQMESALSLSMARCR